MRVFTSLFAMAALVGLATVHASTVTPPPTTTTTPPPSGGAASKAAGAKKPHGYVLTKADKDWATAQLALLKDLKCCKDNKCGMTSNFHKVYTAMDAAGHRKYAYGDLMNKLRLTFQLMKKAAKPAATTPPPTTPPTTPPAGGASHRSQSAEYQLMLVKLMNMTLTTITKATRMPPDEEHAFHFTGKVVHLLHFKNPSMTPADPKAKTKIAMSILYFIRWNAYSRKFLLDYGFEAGIDAAIAELKKKQGGKSVADVSKDVDAAWEAVRAKVNAHRATKNLPALVAKAKAATPPPTTGTPPPTTGATLPKPPGSK